MALLSTVTVDAPAHANYRITWCQPIQPGDLLTDWVLVATGARVARFRISSNVYFCSVRTNGAANAGVVAWDIGIGGPATANGAYTGTVPNLTGTRLTVRAQGTGNPYVANLASSAIEDTLREDTGWKQLRRWTHTTNPSDIDALGQPNAANGVHTYLTYRDDTPCIAGQIRVTNASITVGSYGASETSTGQFGQWGTYVSSFYGLIYFDGTTLTIPAGWNVLWQRPPWSNPGNAHLPRMGYVRRFVLYPTGTSVQEAQAVLDMKGLGVVYAGRSYLNTEAHCANETLIPDIDRPGLYPGGFAGLESQFASMYSTLLNRANAGLFDPNADSTTPYGDFWRAPLGPFRPLGDWNALPPGVVGTAPDAGMAYTRSAGRYWLLFHDLAMEGSGYWCLHKATGRPVSTRDFGNAAIGHGWPQNPTGASPEGVGNPSGRMPFHYNVQGYSGTNSSGIPGLSDVVPGQGTTGQDPTPTPKPLQNGACAFIADLYKWRPRFAGSHYIQHTNRAKIAAYQLGDLVAIDDVRMLAENAAYAWSEAGHLDNIYYPPGNGESLKDFKTLCQANPAQALVWLGREAGWVAECFALDWALADDARRALVLPRMQLMRDVYVADVTACGGHGRQAWDGQFGIFIGEEAWTPPSDPGDPTHAAPAEEEVFSTDIQADLFMNGLFAVCRQLKHAGDDGFAQTRNMMVLWMRQILQPYAADGNTLRWTPSEYQTPQNGGPADPLARSHGPAKYTSVCTGPPGSGIPNGSTPLTFFDVTANPNVLDSKWYLGSGIGITYAPHLIEMLWRLTGNFHDLAKMKILGQSPYVWPTALAGSYESRADEMLSFDHSPFTQGEFMSGLCAFAIRYEAEGYLPEDMTASLPPIILTPTPASTRLQTPTISVALTGSGVLPSPAALSISAPAIAVAFTAGTITITPAAAGVRLQVPFPAVVFDTVAVSSALEARLDIDVDIDVVDTNSTALEASFDFGLDIAVFAPAVLGGDGNLFADARAMLLDLLPPGIAWTRAAEAVLTHVLEGQGDELAQVLKRARDLLRESDPRTTFELLADWERVAGLPDPCAGAQPTIDTRRASVVAKIAGSIEPTVAGLEAFAAALGFDVKIVEFVPFQAGLARAGDAITNAGQPFMAGHGRAGDQLTNTPGWTYVFQVQAPVFSVNHFTAGHGHAGEPLANWTNAVLECELNRIKPAHLLAIFSYSVVIAPDPVFVSILAPVPQVRRQLTLTPSAAALRVQPRDIAVV